jgi:hypothetical protein
VQGLRLVTERQRSYGIYMGSHSSSSSRLGDFSADTRLLLLTPMAALVGLIRALIAYGR